MFGLPERGDHLSLKTTEFTDPYRLFNSDVFVHDTFEPEGLYGAIPYLTGHSKDFDVSVLWMNSAESWVDIFKWDHSNT
jgi:alpha 1,3-glucosidase